MIFISYRRGEDAAAAGRLYDRLEHAFGHQRLFIDVDANIPPGEDFVTVLEAQVAACDVLLAVIGRGWLTATDQTGRRLENPKDFVRIEIASALAQGKRVIPVLVDNAMMPKANELPEELMPLTRRQAVRITHDRFRDDAERLARALEKALAKVEAQWQAEEAKRRAEVEARRQAEEAKRRRAEVEAQRQAEEAKRRAEVEAQAEEAKRRRAEVEARRQAEEAKRRAIWVMVIVVAWCLVLFALFASLREFAHSQKTENCAAIIGAEEVACFLRAAADQGDADAQVNLGSMYENERGVPQDAAEAVTWYRKAADQGNAPAQENLSRLPGKKRGWFSLFA